MRCLKIFNRAAALLAAAAALAACSTSPSEKELKQATEERAPLPAYPQFDRLVPVDLGGNYRYFIDPASISVAARTVVRYTIVARSPAGVNNVTFEGLLCRSRQHRLYGIGREDGTWAPARDSGWDAAGDSVGTYYGVLADFYFCPNGKVVTDAADALQALQLGRHPATAFTPW